MVRWCVCVCVCGGGVSERAHANVIVIEGV